MLKPGKTVGKESEDVHAARWSAYMDRLAGEQYRASAQLRLGGALGAVPALVRARAVARLILGRLVPGLRAALAGR